MGLTVKLSQCVLVVLFLGDGRKGNSDLETSFLLHFLYVADDKSQVQMVLHWALIFDPTCIGGLFTNL